MAIGRPRLDADIRRWQCGGLSPAAIGGDAFAGSRRCALVDPKVAWRHRRGPPPHDQPADPESFRHQLYPPMSPESEQLEEGTPGPNRVTAVALSRNRRRSSSSMPAVPSRLQRRPRGWCAFIALSWSRHRCCGSRAFPQCTQLWRGEKSCASRRPIGDAPPPSVPAAA